MTKVRRQGCRGDEKKERRESNQERQQIDMNAGNELGKEAENKERMKEIRQRCKEREKGARYQPIMQWILNPNQYLWE